MLSIYICNNLARYENTASTPYNSAAVTEAFVGILVPSGNCAIPSRLVGSKVAALEIWKRGARKQKRELIYRRIMRPIGRLPRWQLPPPCRATFVHTASCRCLSCIVVPHALWLYQSDKIHLRELEQRQSSVRLGKGVAIGMEPPGGVSAVVPRTAFGANIE